MLGRIWSRDLPRCDETPWYNWRLVYQKQLYRAGTSNYIHFSVGCNYLSLALIPAPGTKVLNYKKCLDRFPSLHWNLKEFRRHAELKYAGNCFCIYHIEPRLTCFDRRTYRKGCRCLDGKFVPIHQRTLNCDSNRLSLFKLFRYLVCSLGQCCLKRVEDIGWLLWVQTILCSIFP